MSTLGGSRGERNAKPKYSALDINGMYKYSRGDTTEPSVQKNQVRRIHGMQTLGKVPSARRPPANLPSLKAETSSSSNNSVNNNNNCNNTNNLSTGDLHTSNTIKNATSILGDNLSSGINSTSKDSNSTVIGGVGSKLINNSVSFSTLNNNKSSSASGGTNTYQQKQQSNYNQQQKSITWSSVTTGNDYIGVGGGNYRGGKQIVDAPPPYQSPQFQHEFPTLDGTAAVGGNGGHQNTNRKTGNGSERDRERELLQHTNVNHQNIQHQQNHYHRQNQRQYHQQQQFHQHSHRDSRHTQRKDVHNYKDGNDVSGCGSGGSGYGSSSDEHSRHQLETNYDSHNDGDARLQDEEKISKDISVGVSNEKLLQHQNSGNQSTTSNNNTSVSMPFITLMPTFMQRGVSLSSTGNNSTTNSNRNASACNQITIGMGASDSLQNYQQNGILKPVEVSLETNVNISSQSRSGNLTEHRFMTPIINSFRQSNALQKRSNVINNSANGGLERDRNAGTVMRKDQESAIETEMHQIQQPIIREEMFEFMNAIPIDDSWTKQDEIDYNKKLVSSDEEDDEEEPIKGKTANERERFIYSNKNSQNANINNNQADKQKTSNVNAMPLNTIRSNNYASWQTKELESCEREKINNINDGAVSTCTDDIRHQNCHRTSTSTSNTSRNIIAYERSKQRKEEDDRRDLERKQAAARKKQDLEMKMNNKKIVGDNNDLTIKTGVLTVTSNAGENQGATRNNICSGYERTICRDNRGDLRASGDYLRSSGSSANLPGSIASNVSTGSTISNSTKTSYSPHFQSNLPPRFQRQHQQQGITTIQTTGTNQEKANSGSSTITMYENTRYIPKGQQRNMGGQGTRVSDYRDNYTRNYGRSYNDNERDDEQRFYGGRVGLAHSVAREDHGRINNSNMLSRSISDTAQRKISVSSNDENSVQKYIGGGSSNNGKEFVATSYNEDIELKRQRDESFSSTQSHDSVTIKILRRPANQTTNSKSDDGLQEQQEQKTQTHSTCPRITESSDNQISSFTPKQILRRSESNDDKVRSVSKNLSSTSLVSTSETSSSVNTGIETNVSIKKTVLSNINIDCDILKPVISNDDINKPVKTLDRSYTVSSGISTETHSNSIGCESNSAKSPNIQQQEHKESMTNVNTISGTNNNNKNSENNINESSNANISKTDDRRCIVPNQISREAKRPSPRGNGTVRGERSDRNVHTRTYGGSCNVSVSGTYRGNRDIGWSYRSGNRGRYNNNTNSSADSNYQIDSNDHYEEEECESVGKRSDRSPKVHHKDFNSNGINIENSSARRGMGISSFSNLPGGVLDDRGFAPRGEPSRRGRGGSNNVSDRSILSSTSFRRNNNDNRRPYSRHNYDDKDTSKHITELSETNICEIDKNKQNQNALSSGISKIVTDKDNVDEMSNKVMTTSNSIINKTSDFVKTNSNITLSKQYVRSNEECKTAILNNNKIDDDHNNTGVITNINMEKKTIGINRSTNSNNSTSINQINSVSMTALGSCSPQLNKQDVSTTALTSQSNIVNLHQQKPMVTKTATGLVGSNGLLSSTGLPMNVCMETINNNSSNSKSGVDLQKCKSESTCNYSVSLSSVNLRDSESTAHQKSRINAIIPLNGGDTKTNNGGMLIDGAPVNTIIFENTNYKQQAHAVHLKRSSESLSSGSSIVPGVNVTIASVDTISTAFSQMSFGNKTGNGTAVGNISQHADYEKEIKLGFSFGDTADSYNANMTTTDNNNSSINSVNNKIVNAAHIQHHQQQQQQEQEEQAQNIISTAELNMKIASVKKVWESTAPIATDTASSALQHHQHQQQQQQQLEATVDNNGHLTAASFVAAAVAASQHQHLHQQHQQQSHIPHYAAAAVHMQQHHNLSSGIPASSPYGASTFETGQLEQFGPAAAVAAAAAAGMVVGAVDDSTIVGYPSPQQQTTSMQHQQQQNLKHAADIAKQHQHQVSTSKQLQTHHSSGIGMSPPPTLQQQQSVTQQQMHAPQAFYQTSAQFSGIPTIPSPPAVVFNSSQMAPPPSQGGLYPPFHSLDHTSRSQYTATGHSFPNHYGAATAASAGAFSAYPNLAAAPTDLYSNLTPQFRMGGGHTPFGNPNSQQLNNPNPGAVAIISSNSNSLMSTVGSVKQPPSQQLGTIGTKGAANGAGGPFGAAQQYMNLYAPPPHPQGGQPGPPGTHQLQANNYYSNTAGGPNGPTAFYGGPPPQSAGTGAQNYNLAAAAAAAGLYGHTAHQGGPPGSNGPTGPPPQGSQSQHSISNFNTQFINSHLLTAAALNQFRGGPTPQQAAAAAYLKSNQQTNHLQDSMGRQLKSPLGGTDVGINIVKQSQSQPSPPHHKNYTSWDLQNQVIQQHANQQMAQHRTSGNTNGMNQNINGRTSSGGSACGHGANVGVSAGNNVGVSNNGVSGNQLVPGRYPTPIQRPNNYPQQQQQQLSQTNVNNVQQQQQHVQRSGGSNSGGSAVANVVSSSNVRQGSNNTSGLQSNSMSQNGTTNANNGNSGITVGAAISNNNNGSNNSTPVGVGAPSTTTTQFNKNFYTNSGTSSRGNNWL